MIEILGLAGITVGVFYIWHRHVQQQQAAALPIYYGAPAWPAMNPVAVPEIGLPPGTQQAPTYYGVSTTLLEPFLK